MSLWSSFWAVPNNPALAGYGTTPTQDTVSDPNMAGGNTVSDALNGLGNATGSFFGTTAAGAVKPLFPYLVIFVVIIIFAGAYSQKIVKG